MQLITQYLGQERIGINDELALESIHDEYFFLHDITPFLLK